MQKWSRLLSPLLESSHSMSLIGPCLKYFPNNWIYNFKSQIRHITYSHPKIVLYYKRPFCSKILVINLTIFVGNIWSLVWLHWPYWPLCVLWLLWLYWMYWFDWLYWLYWLYSEQCTVGHTMVTNTMGLVFLACKKCAFLAWKKCVGHNMVTYNGSWVCIATPISTSLMEILPDKISRGEGGSFGDTTCYLLASSRPDICHRYQVSAASRDQQW